MKWHKIIKYDTHNLQRIRVRVCHEFIEQYGFIWGKQVWDYSINSIHQLFTLQIPFSAFHFQFLSVWTPTDRDGWVSNGDEVENSECCSTRQGSWWLKSIFWTQIYRLWVDLPWIKFMTGFLYLKFNFPSHIHLPDEPRTKFIDDIILAFYATIQISLWRYNASRLICFCYGP